MATRLNGDRTLLNALIAMRIEPEGAPLRFTDRLARQNGWSPDFAMRVMTEYRRFLFLAAIGTGPVTPSDAVDQAWHLHLAYSRHYWDELCGRILGRPLHHGPAAGGKDEVRHHRQRYRATLDAYRATLGVAPPADIWPPVTERFRPARFERIDRSRHWLIPRRPVLAALLMPVVAGCVLSSGASTYRAGLAKMIGPFVFFVMLFTVLALVGLMGFASRSNDSDGCIAGDSDGDGGDGDGDGDGGGDGGCGSSCGGGCGGGGD